MQILKTWNIRLLESFAYNPQQLNEIASAINPSAAGDGKKIKVKSMSSKSFRSSKQNVISNNRDEPIRRAGSFSKLQTYRTDINGAGVGVGTGSAGNSPAVMRNRQGELVRVGGLPPLPREANVRSWGPDDQYGLGGGPLASLSQDSYGLSSTGVPPPPLPPRPSDRIRGDGSRLRPEEDPDYAYIKEEEIKGPLNPPRTLDPLTSIDDALFELERDIVRDNQARKMEEEEKRRRAARRQISQPVNNSPNLRLGPPVFPRTEPQDYMDFVPQDYSEFKPQSVSVSSDPEKSSLPPAAHNRSASEPDPRPYPSSSKNLSQPPVFEDEEDSVGSVGLNRNAKPLSQKPISKSSHHLPSRSQSAQAFSIMGLMPSLPPRTWRNTSSGNLEVNNSSPANSSPSSSLVTVAENRPKTSQDSYSASLRAADKAIALLGGGDYPMSQSTSSLKAAPAPPISDTHSNTSSTPSSSTVTSTTPTPTSAGTSTSATPQGAPDSSQGKPMTPPPIPPRSPTKDRLSRKSSSSSSSSSSSNRCPRCRGSRRLQKAQVGKTVSLGTALGSNQFPEDCRKSLPDLVGSNKTVPENELKGRNHHGQRSRHCSRCSPESSMETLHDGLEASKSTTSLSNSTFEYLQLVGEEQGKEAESEGSNMDLMSSCLKYLDFLNREIDVTASMAVAQRAGATSSMPPARVTSSSTPASSTTTPAGTGSKINTRHIQSVPISQTSSMTQMPTRRSAAEVKSLEMNLNRAKMETQRTLAALSQPLNPPTTNYGVGLLPVSTHSGFYPVSTHTDVRTSPIPNGHYQMSSTSNPAVTRATRTPHANGMAPSMRSSSTTALTTFSNASFLNSAPPIVPPRSVVSLMQLPPTNSATPTNKQHHQSPRSSSASQIHGSSTSASLNGRKVNPGGGGGGGGQMAHQLPVRTSPSSRYNPRHQSLMRPARQRDHVDASGQSSTVFIHHLKGGLAHLV